MSGSAQVTLSGILLSRYYLLVSLLGILLTSYQLVLTHRRRKVQNIGGGQDLEYSGGGGARGGKFPAGT